MVRGYNMWVLFVDNTTANNYITTGNKTLFYTLTHGDVEQISETIFRYKGKKEITSGYHAYKEELTEIARKWQEDFSRFNYDYRQLAGWGAFFEEYGKKYGLLREFRENGIL